MSPMFRHFVGAVAIVALVGCGGGVAEKGPAESTPQVSPEKKQEIIDKQKEMYKKYNKRP